LKISYISMIISLQKEYLWPGCSRILLTTLENISDLFQISLESYTTMNWVTICIFPYISKFNWSMDDSKSTEIIVRRCMQWSLVRVFFIYSTINDRFPLRGIWLLNIYLSLLKFKVIRCWIEIETMRVISSTCISFSILNIIRIY
jgi:hypothetical protein